MGFRIGQGWDRHPLAARRPCVLGGVLFPECPVGPVGHSDGDALVHALVDALLGAADLGDIGSHFPDTDSRWKGVDSLVFLREAGNLLREKGYQLGNADCTVITEQPRINSRRQEMAHAMAAALQVSADRISVKATRGEGLGPEGRGECVTALAVALILKEERK
jgi:2-C-methyl-D-erythritol 2,4-cyclodiphosphate synthase